MRPDELVRQLASKDDRLDAVRTLLGSVNSRELCAVHLDDAPSPR